MNWLRALCIVLFGTPGEKTRVKPPPAPQDSTGRFERYDTFQLHDGDTLVHELEKLGLPFEVDLSDGIGQVDFRFGSSGEKATMTIFIERENREILDRIVQLHFHKRSWSAGPEDL